MESLRWILIIAGVAILVALWMSGRQSRRDSRGAGAPDPLLRGGADDDSLADDFGDFGHVDPDDFARPGAASSRADAFAENSPIVGRDDYGTEAYGPSDYPAGGAEHGVEHHETDEYGHPGVAPRGPADAMQTRPADYVYGERVAAEQGSYEPATADDYDDDYGHPQGDAFAHDHQVGHPVDQGDSAAHAGVSDDRHSGVARAHASSPRRNRQMDARADTRAGMRAGMRGGESQGDAGGLYGFGALSAKFGAISSKLGGGRRPSIDDLAFDEEASDVPPEKSRPGKIVMLHVVAPEGQILPPEELRETLEGRGYHHGDMDIYHSLYDGKSVFSVARMIKPGTFNVDDLSSYETPGLAFILQLPAPVEAIQAFDVMLQEAWDIAAELGGTVLDGNRSTLGRQTEQHLRESIHEFVHKQKFLDSVA